MELDRLVASDRLRLDTFRPNAVDRTYLGWLDDPIATRFTEVAPGSYTLESARDYVQANLASRDAILCRILLPDSDGSGEKWIGTLRLSGLASKHRRCEIALMIGERGVQGQGLGTDAIRTATAMAMERFDLHKVCAGLYAPNLASLRAFEKAGFEIEARFRDHAILDGAFVDILRLAKFAEIEGGAA